ncbi:MAG TPA: L-threonylcarbamoyladenylate synthase [Candidatus Saccharimonadales bacterium]|nr:L-threonylcarbamoyladenylate synthase [Candidatus Saccharimonadales bacterium]
MADGPEGRDAAVATLEAGGIVAVPTDTVYGLAVALSTPGGIERVFQVKQRPPDRGIVLLLDEAAQMADLATVTPAAEALAAACWPGGLTIVLEQRDGVALSSVLTGGASTIGVRVPAHDAPRALARALGPLPTTSANVSGSPELANAAAILERLGDGIDLILDGGAAPGGVASTVVDASGPSVRILRAGAIDAQRIADLLVAAGLPPLA